MTFMHDHWDALGAGFGTAGLFIFLTLMLLKANDDNASALRETYRALRDADYQRLRKRYIAAAQASADRAARFDQHASQAERLATDEPVPYLPVWTTDDDNLSAEFEDLMHRAFIADEERTR